MIWLQQFFLKARRFKLQPKKMIEGEESLKESLEVNQKALED